MNTPTEKTNEPGTQLSRIYKTDPYGFPIYPADEELHQENKEGQDIDPDAISPAPVSDPDDDEETKIYESKLNM